jgi:hypothetical protein
MDSLLSIVTLSYFALRPIIWQRAACTKAAAELQQAIRASRLTIPMLNSILRVSSL